MNVIQQQYPAARLSAMLCWQIEMHPNWRNDRVLDWAKEHGIHITAYAPLSSPDTAATEDAPNLMKVPVPVSQDCQQA